MGWYELLLASILSFEIMLYVRSNDLGHVLGADDL